jgi:phenylpropionate dioxygenase-like ring-hydroxylating dioxygenase large terminal subunit
MTSDGRYRVAFPRRAWYPACESSDLKRRPLAVTLMDTPLALFRDGRDRPRALLDRCPHRNLPLSLGRVHGDGCLECGYHGWRFDGTGHCSAVPGLLTELEASPARDVVTYATTEQDGFVWVWGEPGVDGMGRPFALPEIAQAQQTIFSCDLDCTMHAALENALDVPHTAFLHQGLFRGGEPRPITAVRKDLPGGVEVQYVGEPVAFGPLRLKGTDLTFDHWDRFFLPSIAQVEYRVRGWLTIVNTILHLPMSPFRTRAWFVVRYRTRVPGLLARPIVAVRGHQILRQDARVLAQQSGNIRRFGHERFTSTDLDLIGNSIWRLLREAERAEGRERPEPEQPDDGPTTAEHGDGDDAEPTRSSVTFGI